VTETFKNVARLAGTTDVIVIGAGHAGLSMSYVLGELGIDHVVLERGEIANSWRRERWDSLRLLTPNWRTQLPGRTYDGDDPDGFMSVAELVDLLDDYAANSGTPVHTGTDVLSLQRYGHRYRVTTNRGVWTGNAVVVATGACNQPSVPAVSKDIPAGIDQLTPFDYRCPGDIRPGGILVVGASATGLQLADELLRSGRDVTLAAGEHVRMPRRYRGRDIFYWLDRCGIHDERFDEIDDINRGRHLPSPQLVGSHDKPILDLNHLSAMGAKIAGRLMGVRHGIAQFSGSLRNVCSLADLKMNRLLAAIDEYADADGAAPAETFEPTRIASDPLLTLDLERAGIGTVIWATGFRPDYSWLDVPVFDRKGRLEHEGGVVKAPGLYVLGLPLMRRRKSSFIFGIEDDVRDISNHLVAYITRKSGEQSNGFYQDNSTRRGYRRSA
jgi:putative flavoprotein involved in K+ transport